MAVEDHPMFPKWKSALDHLIKAKEALKEGRATQKDVDKALDEYNKIADEI